MYKLDKVKWNYGAYQIGIADFRLPPSGIFRVQVMQKNREGEQKYTGWFELDVKKIRECQTQQVGKDRSIRVYLVPLEMWERKGVPVKVEKAEEETAPMEQTRLL